MPTPVAASVESLPAIVYRGQPVITTDRLAGMYGVMVKNIQNNFQQNKERFTEGKHFFRVAGEELTNLQAVLNGVQICSSKVRRLLLWTAKGSARHAKMLNTDSAWDVYERMEDGYFEILEQGAAQGTPKPAPADLPVSTTADRAPLRALCAEWARKMAAPGQATQDHHRATSLQLKANFQLDTIKQLPVAWIPDAIAFVQEKIDGLQVQASLPAPKPKEEKQMALPMAADNSAEIAKCVLEIKATKQVLMDKTTELYHLIRENIRPSGKGLGTPHRSMIVRMNDVHDELFYGLDRQLNAIECFAAIGGLASKSQQAGR